jgi:cytochrome oxidase assembly protein ShyY1
VPRFLLSRRWIGFALFVLVLAGICVRLGFWQLHRLEHRLDTNDRIREHFAAAPAPLDEVVPRGRDVTQAEEWTRVTVTGTYDADHELTVKFTVRDGAPGADVVTPLVLSDGTAVLVDRGWVPTKNTGERPTSIPAPPPGVVTITGWLRPDNGAREAAVTPSEGQVRAVSSVGLESYVGRDLRHGYVNLRSQQPAAEKGLELEPKPDLGQGPHFFYALQWWFFALLAVSGYVYFAIVERRERREAQAKETRSA